MSFYNPSGGCFLHDTLVKLSNGDFTPVQDITKGTKLSSNGNTSTVVCVIKLKFSGIIRKFKPFDSTALTPYHPILLENNQWIFPNDSDHFTDVTVKDVYVYDFVLDSHHTVELFGGINAVTFGHGIEGEVVGHQYFGTEKIVNDLQKHPGWESGLIVLDDYKFIRDPQSNLVTGLVF